MIRGRPADRVRLVNTKVPIATHKNTCFSIALALSEA